MRVAILLVIGVLIAGVAGAAVKEKDPALGKPVTLAVKGEALCDILPMLEKQTGTRLKVSRELADRKATIFVDAKPLEQVMNGIATLFRCEWSVRDVKGKSIHELWLSEKTRRLEMDSRQKALDAAWVSLNKQINSLASSFPKDKEEYWKVRAANEEASKTNWSALTDEERQAQREAFDKGRLYDASVTAALIKCFSPKAMKAFKEGMTICYDSRSPEPEWQFPQNIADTVAAMHSQPTDSDGPNQLVGSLALDATPRIYSDSRNIYIDVIGGISAAAWLKSPNGDSSRVRGYGLRNLLLQTSAPLPTEPVLENYLPQAPYSETFNQEIRFSEEELRDAGVIPSPYGPNCGMYTNRSDVLQLLHQRLGIQIISDYYSEWTNYLPDTRCSAKLRVEILCNPINRQIAFHGWDGTFLYTRAVDPWMLERTEVPNRFLRKWQETFSTRGWLGPDEMAEMAILGDEYAKHVPENAVFLKLAKGERTFGIDTNYLPIYRFYGLLTPKQRKQAMSGPVSISELTPEQRGTIADFVDLHWNSEPGPLFGIYKNGVRIDKPGAVKPTIVSTFEMQAKEKDPEPFTQEKNAAKYKSMEYKFIFRADDGRNTSRSIDFRVYPPPTKEEK